MKRGLIAFVLAFALIATTATASNFGRLFNLPGFTNVSNDALSALAQTQLDKGQVDGEASREESSPPDNTTMPAAFTYFGQFLDHDLTLDLVPQPTEQIDPTTIPNNRTFLLDLDSVFGGGPQVSPQLYDGEDLLIQEPNVNGVPDVPRTASGTAIIGDPRNDENQIIGQIQVASIKFHNRLVDEFGYSDRRARKVETQYWQWLVLHEILPHFVGQDRVDQYFYRWYTRTPLFPHNTFTPVEFSVAAYRFGHSMVRNAYNLNEDEDTGEVNTVKVFSFEPGADTLMGGAPIQAGHQIEWGNFVPELNENGPEAADINFSRPIDTLISNSLFQLPIPGAEGGGSNVLGFRNMLRAKFYALPSGQQVAAALGLPVIPAYKINPTDSRKLNKATPLWYYILAESEREGGARLGAVGSAIVAQTIIRVLADDESSILNRKFTPAAPFTETPGTFTLADFLVFAGVAERPEEKAEPVKHHHHRHHHHHHHRY